MPILSPDKEKTFSVSAIRQGTAIDHITTGNALTIIELLNLAQHKKKVSVGLNLPSKTLKYKDIIKVEDRILSPEEANQIAILTPHATINIIEDYKVVKKFAVALPDTISKVVVCPNSDCVTNHEKATTHFYVKQRPHSVQLKCKYCERTFIREEIKNYNT